MNSPSASLRLWLVRHGETEYNARNIVQGGGIDSDLNAKGRTQAQRFHARHQHTAFAAVYCSGMRRTRQTLAPWQAAGHTVVAHPGLNELNWGIYEGRILDATCQDELRPIVDAWANGDVEAPVPGGESPAQAWQRAGAALAEIAARHAEGNLLICTHGRILRIVLSNLVAEGLQDMQAFKHQNTGLNIIRRTLKGYAAELLNDLSHLS